MATWHDSITPEQAKLIDQSPLFFVASADPALGAGPGGAGPVNVSPKGGVPLHVLSPNRVAYLDYTGSGNETARHAAAGGPVTVMVCSFEAENAGIVRLYGTATVIPVDKSSLASLLLSAPADDIALPVRQVVDIAVTRTVTSCGYGVPIMRFVSERTVSNRGRAYKQGRSRQDATLCQPAESV
jgi:hypothetical protein